MAAGRFFVSRGGLSPALRRRGDGERDAVQSRDANHRNARRAGVPGDDPSRGRTGDHVLEVGCEWGTTTAVLARYAAHVIGTDISPKCIGRARAMRPGLDFRVLDAFDVRSVLDLGLPVTTVYMDLSGLSGYRGLLDLIALIQGYAGIVRPETMVVKSGALKHFAQRCSPWQGAGDLPAV